MEIFSLLILLWLWLAMGVSAASIAHYKGRSAGGWCALVLVTTLFGILPGLIFFLILVCLPPITPTVWPQIVGASDFAARVRSLPR